MPTPIGGAPVAAPNAVAHNVELELFSVGACYSPEALAIEDGAPWPVRFPTLVGLIHHPVEGLVVFDTGNSWRFYRESINFPNFLYALTTPVEIGLDQTLVAQLRARGIRPEDVRHVVLSHFHADHIGGCRDFPNATFHFRQAAYDAVRDLNAFEAVRAAYMPGLLPDDFWRRSAPVDQRGEGVLPAAMKPFGPGFDLFGDGTLIAVDLPGHASGHMGLYVPGDQPTFFVADACYSSRAFRERKPPAPFARWVLNFDPAYEETLAKLHALHQAAPEIRIVPTHCPEVARTVGRGA